MADVNFIPVEGDVLETNGGVFLFPNGLIHTKNLLPASRERIVADMKAICELNSLTFNPETDLIAECWLTSSDFICKDKYNWNQDNIGDHPSFVNFQGKNVMVSFRSRRFLPVELCNRFKEGEITDIWLPAQMSTSDKVCHAWQDPNCVTTACLLHLEACQLKTRYPHHGGFQQCLDVLKTRYAEEIANKERSL